MPESPPQADAQPAVFRYDLRLRIIAVALVPLLLAIGVLAAYYVHREITSVRAALEERGRVVSQRLAAASAFDLFAGNSLYLKRLLDYELNTQKAEAIGIADSASRWWLVSGHASVLPAPQVHAAAGQWRTRDTIYFSYPIRLESPVEGDPYLGSERPAAPTIIGQVVVALSTAPVNAARRDILLASLSLAAVLLLATGLLAWRLSQGLSRPLHAIIAAVKDIAGGTLASRVEQTAPGEIGELARGINQMAAALQENTAVLQQRVEEATAELRGQKQAAEAAGLARSKFMAAASHDLRQPMHAMSLLISALKDKVGPTSPEVLRLSEHIEASIHSMEALLNAILDISRLDAGVVVARPECFPVASILERLERQFTPLAAERGLALRIRKTRLAAFTDPMLLERILGNLVSNAIRYTDRGKVLVGLRRVQKDWLRFEVWDTGKGIPPAYTGRIFEEYFQLENPERDRDKGLGLGLAIVQRLARLLGSPVEVRSTLDRGSCFSIRAVRCEPAADAHQEIPAQPVAPPIASSLVAFIDDDETILEAMAAVFEQWGIELAAGTDAQQVKADLLELGRRPDAILSDYRLRGGRTGIEAIAELRATFGPDIPAALITGDIASATIQAIVASGMLVLHKPLKPAKLRAFLHHLLARQEPSAPASL